MRKLSVNSAVLFFFLLLIGCQNSTPAAGELEGEAVDRSRLVGARLEHISEPFEWRLTESGFVLESREGSLPGDLTESLLGDRAETQHIEGAWRLGAEGKSLELTDIRSGERQGKAHVSLALVTAGNVRVNLGEHQYNVMKDTAATERKVTDENLVQSAVDRTIKAILEDIKGLKGDLPQLAEIESVRIHENGFTYSKGLQSPIKVPNPKFEENGGYISVEIKVYHPKRDPKSVRPFTLSARAWDHYEVKDGTRYAVWTIAVAESNQRGREFERRIEALISKRLRALYDELAPRPVISPFDEMMRERSRRK